MARTLWYGLAAGAAGTTVLNLVTYLDRAVRGRPASTTPEETVRKFEDVAHVALATEEDKAGNRRSGIGALLGIAAGLGSGLGYALARPRLRRIPLPVAGLGAGLVANAATVAPMAAAGVSDPRKWPASSWLSDVVPHLAYGLATAAVFDLLDRRR
jgi:hypothetical protein